MAREQFCRIASSARVAGCAGPRIQIVVAGDKMSAEEQLHTLSEHRRGIAPDTHLPFFVEFRKNGFKCDDSLGIVFEEQKRFHVGCRGSKNFSAIAFTAASILMSGGPGRWKPSRFFAARLGLSASNGNPSPPGRAFEGLACVSRFVQALRLRNMRWHFGSCSCIVNRCKSSIAFFGLESS